MNDGGAETKETESGSWPLGSGNCKANGWHSVPIFE